MTKKAKLLDKDLLSWKSEPNEVATIHQDKKMIT